MATQSDTHKIEEQLCKSCNGRLQCESEDPRSTIPDSKRWILNKRIDFLNNNERGQTVPRDLGKIAESVVEWDGAVGDELDLSTEDRIYIRGKAEDNCRKQRYYSLLNITPPTSTSPILVAFTGNRN